MEGKCKFFDSLKGFGFIIEAETGKEFFCHHTDTLDKIETDDKVEFELEEGHRGPKAVQVKRINK